MKIEIILWTFVGFIWGIAFTLILRKLDEYFEKRENFELMITKLYKFLERNEEKK